MVQSSEGSPPSTSGAAPASEVGESPVGSPPASVGAPACVFLACAVCCTVHAYHLNVESNRWVIDSGATCHVAKNLSSLSNRRSCHVQLRTAGGGTTSVTEVGSATVATGDTSLHLSGALHVPDAPANLFSMSAYLKQYPLHSFVVSAATIALLDEHGRELATGQCDDSGLFYFDPVYFTEFAGLNDHLHGPKRRSPVPVCPRDEHQYESLSQLHDILGHRAASSIKTAVLSGQLKGFDKVLKLKLPPAHEVANCQECLRAHQNANPVPPQAHEKANEIGNRLYADLAGPFPEASYNGNKYALFIVDDLSSVLWISFHRHKSESFNELKYRIEWIEKRGGEVKEVRSDPGGEFIGKNLKAWMKEHLIDWIHGPAKGSHHQGKPERCIQTIKRSLHAMLYRSNLPFMYWEAAAEYATYIHNRFPTRANENYAAPMKYWYGIQGGDRRICDATSVPDAALEATGGDPSVPNLSHLPGCFGIALDLNVSEDTTLSRQGDPATNPHGMEFNSKRGVYLGFREGVGKGYQFLNLQTGLPELRVNAIPDRTCFPTVPDATLANLRAKEARRVHAENTEVIKAEKALAKAEKKRQDLLDKEEKARIKEALRITKAETQAAEDRIRLAAKEAKAAQQREQAARKQEERALKANEKARATEAKLQAAADKKAQLESQQHAQAQRNTSQKLNQTLQDVQTAGQSLSPEEARELYEIQTALPSARPKLTSTQKQEQQLLEQAKAKSLSRTQAAYKRSQRYLNRKFNRKLPAHIERANLVTSVDSVRVWQPSPVPPKVQTYFAARLETLLYIMCIIPTIASVFMSGAIFNTNVDAVPMKEDHIERCAYLFSKTQAPHDVDPKHYYNAINPRRPDRTSWISAMEDELLSITKCKVWEEYRGPLPTGATALNTTWVYKKKMINGNLDKYKARLCVQGCHQEKGVNFDQTYAPVVGTKADRMLMSLAASKEMYIRQMDVKTAFLNGDIDMPNIFLKIPNGVRLQDPSATHLLLKKSLYGLKQSPRIWNLCLSEFLISQGFESFRSDRCVWVKHSNTAKLHDHNTVYCSMYVDDLLIYGANLTQVHTLQDALRDQFEMSDLGSPAHYLGKTIRRTSDTGAIHLDLQHYTEDIIDTFKPHILQHQKTVEHARMATRYDGDTIFQRHLPMAAKAKLRVYHCSTTDPLLPESTSDANTDLHGTKELYQKIMGRLTFLQCQTRPDISFAVNALSRYKDKPCVSHWASLMWLLQYLHSNSAYGITYAQSTNNALDTTLIGYCDSDWAGDADTSKSTTGYIFKLAGGVVSYSSKRQRSVTRSATEAELFAAADAVQEALWIRKFLAEAGFPQKQSTLIFEDNQGCIAISENGINSNSRLRHVNLRMHFVEESVQAQQIRLHYIPTRRNIADLLTKNVSLPVQRELFKYLVSPSRV